MKRLLLTLAVLFVIGAFAVPAQADHRRPRRHYQHHGYRAYGPQYYVPPAAYGGHYRRANRYCSPYYRFPNYYGNSFGVQGRNFSFYYRF